MNRKFYLLILLVFVFIALSVRQYIDLNRQQRNETAEFINTQIILCGKSMEDASNDFEESVKFEFSNRDLQHFFDTEPGKLDQESRSRYLDGEIKRIRRFYSRHQVLISKITIFDTSAYRVFERNSNNYFSVSPPQLFPQKVLLISQPKLDDAKGKPTYTQPIRNTQGELVANIRFELQIPDFLSFHFGKFYIGKNSWCWAIDTTGQILFHKYSEQDLHEEFATAAVDEFRTQLQQNLTARLQHTIQSPKVVNAYSVFYPVNILGKKTGIVFSVNTDTLWKSQNESSIAIFLYFLVVLASVIALFWIILRQMMGARKRLESTDAMLRIANQASEVLLTDPDFDSAIRNFLEITAKALGYHRAYLMEYTRTDHNEFYKLKYEWWDPSRVESIGALVPGIQTGIETSAFKLISAELRQNKIVKQNGPNFDDSFKTVVKPLSFEAFVNLPVYTEDHIYGVIGFVDCVGYRQWQDFENALFANFANAVGGALSIQKKKEELITSRNLAETANKAKSEFLANMSHEIRTPMNSILGFSEVMLNTTENPKQKSYLKTILESGKMLLSLINDILDLSKIEAGRMEISPEPADLREITHEILHLFQYKTQEKNIGFTVEIDDRIPQTIVIDEVRLRQILLNLVGNAVKFTHVGQVKIEVRLLDDKNGVIAFEIAVVDTGIGITPENQQFIFESFSQQSGQDSRKYGGTGLGLSISKRLIELMHGKIGLESTPGQGSRFVITFRNIKYSDEIVEQEGQFMWDEENIVFKGSKILIVDDVPHNRNLVRTYFEAYDLNIYEAGNGEMAIQMAQEVMPDLIFMDIRMPGLNGYQATELIKSVRATAGIPVIALTASTMQSEINKLEKLFDGYLRKPVQKKTLLNELIKRLPCDILKPAAGNDTDTREKVLKMKAVEIPNEVKILFGQAFSEKITSQSEFIRVDDLIELTKKIESFAVQHKIPQLKAKCDDLNNYVEAFNFEQIQSCLITIKEMFHDKDQVV